MNVVAVALVLGALLVLLLLRTSWLGLGSATVCVLFRLVVGFTPAGPSVHQAPDSSGTWLWAQVSSL